MSKKKNPYSCEGRIEKSVPRDHRLSSLGKPRGAKRRSSDTFFYPTLTLMIDSYIMKQQKDITTTWIQALVVDTGAGPG